LVKIHQQLARHFCILIFFLCCIITLHAQQALILTQPATGPRVMVVNKTYPLLKILLPGQPVSERGIEVEFPEHVTGLNEQSNTVEHLYLVTNGTSNKRTLPEWKTDGNTLMYETELNGNIKMTARVQLDDNAVRYSYEFVNRSTITYANLQAVTCVKLFSDFSDTLLERTFVHHANGFDLLASETPGRLTMPLQKWLPCRYLVSYSWPVVANKIEKDDDGITRYNKSRKADKPFIATLSHNKKWVAATYTAETGNLWTNPERSCQHADPAVTLQPKETKSLRLTTFIYKGDLSEVLQLVNREQANSKNN